MRTEKSRSDDGLGGPSRKRTCWRRLVRASRATSLPLAAVTLVGLLAALAAALTPALHSAIEIGPDEHYEVMKAMLWGKGYPLYQQMWNDQPPLHTILLGLLFRCFGPTIGVARALAVFFGVVLLAGCFVLVRKRCGHCAAFVAALALMAAPQTLELSVSAMLEVPAMAVGLWALWPVYHWVEKPGGRRLYLLIASGVLLATSLQIKLTAAIFAPALCAEIFFATAGDGLSAAKCRARHFLLWGGCVAIWFVLLGMLFGSGYRMAWAAHFSARTHEATSAMGHSFPPSLLLDHLEGFIGACTGLVLGAWPGGFRRILFPYVLLLTVAAVHLVHRPWWPYYYLHLTIPMAWLTGYAVIRLFRLPFQASANHGWRRIVGFIGASLSATALLVLIAMEGGGRLVSEVAQMRGLPQIENSLLITAMREYAGRTRWVYARSTIYAFHANLSVPPELAVLVKKRFWSGQISEREILAIIQRYAPEQIVVSGEELLSDDYLRKAGYAPVYESGEGTLYVAGSLR
jgi:4-amino-4-deoxy-L-arabinose transferase-like glycosyltransferase